MPRKYIQYYKNIVCHLYNRGVNKDKIFREEEDYLFYLRRIKKYKDLHKIEFISYALLPNHFHFIARQLTDGEYSGVGSVPSVPGTLRVPGTSTPKKGTITNFMHDLQTSYVYYFNKKYKRVGHLFQDRFKQKVVEDEKYLIWLAGYVNGNPMIHKVVEDSKDWQYSSYLDYIGKRNGTICNKESVSAYFSNSKSVPGTSNSASPFAEHVNEVVEMCKKRKEDLKDLEYELGM